MVLHDKQSQNGVWENELIYLVLVSAGVGVIKFKLTCVNVSK